MADAYRRIGARELRHGLSDILDQVYDGATFEITDRGKPVARLVPLPGRESLRDRLIASGDVEPARERFTPLPPLPAGTVVYLDGQVALDLQRDEAD